MIIHILLMYIYLSFTNV